MTRDGKRCACPTSVGLLLSRARRRGELQSMAKISIHNGKVNVPDNPTLPFIRGDGTGPDIWAASERVFDAAVKKAYGGKRKIEWLEVFAGETAFQRFNNWLP